MSKNFYLIVENADIFSATANGNLFTTGFPSLTNFLGLAEFIRYKLNEKQNNLIDDISISIVVNDMQYQDNHNKFMLYRHSDNIKSGQLNASTVDEKKVSLNVNLYFKIEVNQDYFINDEEKDTFNFIQKTIDEIKYNLKIAGSRIFNHLFYLTKNKDDIMESLNRKRHSFILEQSDFDISKMQFQEIVEILNGFKSGVRKQLLLQTGYKLLENFSEIKNNRNFNENAIAEPIINFIQVRKVYSYLFNDNYSEVQNFFNQKLENNEIILKYSSI